MAEIELAPLSHRLDEDEMRTLAKLLVEAGAPPFDKSDEHASHTIAARISEEALTEFLDRLDAHDLGAEIYVPLEFEGRVTIGDFRVASSQALLDVLEEMREELSVDLAQFEEGKVPLSRVETLRAMENEKFLVYYVSRQTSERARLNVLRLTGTLLATLK